MFAWKVHPASSLYVILLFAGAFAFSSAFQALPGDVLPIWPASGVAFAAVLLFGYRIWPALVLGALVGHFVSVTYFQLVGDLWFALFFGTVCNAAPPLFFVWLMKRLVPGNYLRIRVFNGFVMLLAGLAQSITSMVAGVTGLYLMGQIGPQGIFPSALQWFLSNTFGIIVCTPAIVSMTLSVTVPAYRKEVAVTEQVPEKIAWLICLATSIGLLLPASNAFWLHNLTLTFLPLALLIWSGMRFPPVYSLAATALVVLTYIWFLGRGVGEFPDPRTVWDVGVLVLFFTTFAILPQLVAASTFERQQYARKLSYRADYDQVTGLLNRQGFEDRASRVLAETGTDEPMALCYLDLDQFKIVNDTMGHEAGDHLIAQIGIVLEQCIHPGDLLGRLGGDEFCVLLRNCHPEEALARAENLRAAVEAHRFMWRRLFAFTVSIGVVQVDSKQRDFSVLLREADTACYTAKDQGRNRVRMRTTQHQQVVRNQEHMESAVDINEALEQNRFRLYCQNIEPLNQDHPGGAHFEILLRMMDREGTLRMPGCFLPAAERFHLMPKVDRWVVEHALGWFERHPQYLRRASVISLNLAGSSMGDEEFLAFLHGRIAASSVPHHKICFEITETAAIGDLNMAVHFVSSLKSLGCRFALDDFGSGLASFAYLKILQVDFLKIDGIFVRDMMRSEVDQTMVRAIHEVGHVMGKKTIAEGVEDRRVLVMLGKLGIDYVQGDVTGQPQPLRDFCRAMALDPGLRDDSLSGTG